MSKKFSTGPQFSEYVWVVCRNTKGTCLKSVSKTPTFRFFRDTQSLKRLVHTSSQMANFGQFLAKMGETRFFQKSAWKAFFRAYKSYLHAKFHNKRAVLGLSTDIICLKQYLYKLHNCTNWITIDWINIKLKLYN